MRQKHHLSPHIFDLDPGRLAVQSAVQTIVIMINRENAAIVGRTKVIKEMRNVIGVKNGRLRHKKN